MLKNRGCYRWCMRNHFHTLLDQLEKAGPVGVNHKHLGNESVRPTTYHQYMRKLVHQGLVKRVARHGRDIWYFRTEKKRPKQYQQKGLN